MAQLPNRLFKNVARELHQKGMEMTPDEVKKEGIAALNTIRRRMRILGHKVPDGDAELLEWMRQVMGGNGL